MDVDEQLDLDLDGGSIDLPPVEEGEPPRRQPHPAAPARRVAPWLLLIALAVAIERLSMIAVVATPDPIALSLAAVLFVSVPVVAGVVLAVQFARARDADLGRS